MSTKLAAKSHDDELHPLGCIVGMAFGCLFIWSLVRTIRFQSEVLGWTDIVSNCTSPLGIILWSINEGLTTGSWLTAKLIGGVCVLFICWVTLFEDREAKQQQAIREFLEIAQKFSAGELPADEYHRVTLETVQKLTRFKELESASKQTNG